MLDLARELQAIGHEVKLYSFVPRGQAVAFGLPKECHVSLLPFVLPLVAWERVLPRLGRALRERLMFKALNWAVILRMRRCDVFIFMSGIYLEAARAAKQRFGARLWLERGSQHILAQDEILAAVSGDRPGAFAIRRELEGYALADRIVIPSTHVQESFRRDATSYGKLFRNSYGVDTGMFTPVRLRKANCPITLLYTGSWSLQKGCDVLAEAVRRVPGIHLVHVGSIGDYSFPQDDGRFSHVDSTPQRKLWKIYSEADGFVLASRQDGFGMVLSQALATGLPVIGTDRTGAADLALTPALSERIVVVPHGNVEALAEAIVALRDRLISGGAFPPLADEDREALSWTAYGRRYGAELLQEFGREKIC
jgi:glycosyltransferase involved in cell wall biosynthesis